MNRARSLLFVLLMLLLMSGAAFSVAAVPAAQEPCVLDMEPIVNALTHAQQAAASGQTSDVQVFLDDAQTALDDLRTACAAATTSNSGSVTAIVDSGIELPLIFTGENDAFTIHYPEGWGSDDQSFSGSTSDQRADGASFGPSNNPNPLPNEIQPISFAVGHPIAIGRFIGLMDTDQMENIPFDGLNTFEQLMSEFVSPSSEITLNDRVIDRITIGDYQGVRMSLELVLSEPLAAVIYVIELSPGEIYGAFGLIAFPDDLESGLDVLNAMVNSFQLQAGK